MNCVLCGYRPMRPTPFSLGFHIANRHGAELKLRAHGATCVCGKVINRRPGIPIWEESLGLHFTEMSPDELRYHQALFEAGATFE